MREEPTPKIDGYFRNEIIEECARVAESIRAHTGDYAIQQAAAAIRALKDKP